jgi:hypothetical protein
MILETMRFPTCWSQSRGRGSRSGRRGINRRGRLSMSGRDHSRRCSRRRCKGRRGHRSYVFKRKRGGWRGAGGAGSVMMRTYYIARCTLGPPPRNLDSRSLSRDRRRLPSCEQSKLQKLARLHLRIILLIILRLLGRLLRQTLRHFYSVHCCKLPW